MKYATAQRVLQYERGSRASREDRELFSAQLVRSCENRIKHLQAESLDQMMPSQVDNQSVHDQAEVMEKWNTARRICAWNHHRRAVCSVLDKRDWWQTQLAGDERDIRQVVVAKSPWEDENKIWQWPRSENNNQRNHDRPSSTAIWPSMEIHRFLVGDKNVEESHNQPLDPVDDDEASEWWRAHCTQSHLAINGALMIEKPYSAEFSNNVTSEGDVFPVCTSEIVANRDLYKLQQRAKRAARTKSLELDVEQRIKSLVTRVERQVHEMEVQVEANTQLALEIEQRKVERRARITREQQSAMTIQRYARGMQGRKHAREMRAEFFVMVRGRAIRRGRCEECGDQRAVLECQQCEESVHFCPICWVHVHSTRRRKTHVAIPMTTVVAPITMKEAGSTKVPTLKEPAVDSTKTNVVNVEKTSSPKLRALPSPRKETTIRTAEPAAVQSKKRTIIHSSKQDHIQNTVPSRVTSSPKITTPELSEACELARRVRAEVQETPTTAETVEIDPAQGIPQESASIRLIDDNLGTNEVDFSTIEGDGAVMNAVVVENDLEELKEAVEAPVQSVTTVISEQTPDVESVSSLPPSASVPESTSNDHDLQSGASTPAKTDTAATTKSLEHDAKSKPELSAKTVELGNTANDAVTSKEESRDTDNPAGSAIAGGAEIPIGSAVGTNELPTVTGAAEQDPERRLTEETSQHS
ncbi:hypothetical protein F442_12420 [Phytophthora nicotianae P10297]|uniref:Uncharacterized protein n=1 Tax=Phytophthora nicotianae P10297 TaxID=1317064 RepID=W2YZK1_PHYNI|nr:hypothetical protein F442_12420 [Phytophthora nicotianae P10297]